MASAATGYLARMKQAVTAVLWLALAPAGWGQLTRADQAFTRADTLRGSIGPGRAWWDAVYYDVSVRPDFQRRTIAGRTIIAFDAVAEGRRMQIDLQQPLTVDSIVMEASVFQAGSITVTDRPVDFTREGNVIWIELPQPMKAGEASTVTIHYHGEPIAAKNPPWDGGWIWRKDDWGKPWMSVACQGLGASSWYPCKDHQSDEPQRGATLRITAPDSLQAIGNGRLRSKERNGDGTTTWNWQVTSPINTYNLVPYIGGYVHWSTVHPGLDGPLDCDFWVLAANEAAARAQFAQVPGMLRCFEEWLGPYPFYIDGYKLVEAPHLGMEHQSAVAYGNQYRNGYLGMDLSGTGHGMAWDYILVHESGHEWFGNSISTADIADMWVHEGFTMYTEVLHTECLLGREAADAYCRGIRRNIRNDRPLIGPYGVNEEGSGDMYPKGANLLHTIRAIVGDSTFRAMLLEMNRRFRHRIVTSAEVEGFMIGFDGRTKELLHPSIFDQYLRSTKVPVLEWGVRKGRLMCRWANGVPGLRMPVLLEVGSRTILTAGVTADWTTVDARAGRRAPVRIDPNLYIGEKRVSGKRVGR